MFKSLPYLTLIYSATPSDEVHHADGLVGTTEDRRIARMPTGSISYAAIALGERVTTGGGCQAIRNIKHSADAGRDFDTKNLPHTSSGEGNGWPSQTSEMQAWHGHSHIAKVGDGIQ